jgi:hypothetical protein
MQRFFVVILFLKIGFHSNAQINGSNHLEFSTVDFGSSRFRLQTQSYSIDEFRALMLSPKMDFINDSEFQLSNHTWRTSSNSILASVGFLLNNNGPYLKGNPLLRFGLGYTQSSPQYAHFGASSSTTIDSVFVPNSSMPRPLDSIYNANISFRSNMNFINLSASILWQTDPELRFSLYGGFGVGFGITSTSSITVNYNETTHKEILYSNGATYLRYDYSSTSFNEWVDAQPWHSFSFSSLAGVDFRWGRRGRPMSYFHLFFEIGPNYQILSADTMSPSNFYGVWTSWGCRFRIPEIKVESNDRISGR